MKMIPVTSTNIVAIGYEPADRYLFVQFAKDTFRYEDVSPETWGAFLGAESKGKFFAAEIKGQYRSFKVPIQESVESEQ